MDATRNRIYGEYKKYKKLCKTMEINPISFGRHWEEDFTFLKKEEQFRLKAWIGVDLDGTLAELNLREYIVGKPEFIGKPIPAMINRIKKWTKEEKTIKIFTARVAEKSAIELETTPERMENNIHDLFSEDLGFDLVVTCL